jgi:STE24 endopeptidase
LQVVVIFIICLVSLLFVYMLFLLCLDPLLQHRPAHYSEHQDEEVNLVNNQAAAFLTFIAVSLHVGKE